jgi:hypothetical protein
MQLLEYFYNKSSTIHTYYQRKFFIPDSKKVLIYGSPWSGKSYLVLDYLTKFEQDEVLYIDFQDPKLQFITLTTQKLNLFIKENSIKIVVLDHYTHDYFKRLPNANQLIIVSDIYYEYIGFEAIKLSLLDYEEFFSFQKNSSEKQVFNLFLKRGTLPQLSSQIAPKEQLFKLFIKSHFDKSQQKLLSILAHFNTHSVTTFQIYNYAKERYKISKDLIYKQIKEFQKRDIIVFIPDYTNSNKKLLFFDFALAKYLSLSQNFPKQFDSMVALSLLKHNIKFKTFGMSGYITEKNILIIPAPFESEESFWKKAHNRFPSYKKSSIQKIYIITVATQYEFKIEEILFEALPFYEWVVINEEN